MNICSAPSGSSSIRKEEQARARKGALRVKLGAKPSRKKGGAAKPSGGGEKKNQSAAQILAAQAHRQDARQEEAFNQHRLRKAGLLKRPAAAAKAAAPVLTSAFSYSATAEEAVIDWRSEPILGKPAVAAAKDVSPPASEAGVPSVDEEITFGSFPKVPSLSADAAAFVPWMEAPSAFEPGF